MISPLQLLASKFCNRCFPTCLKSSCSGYEQIKDDPPLTRPFPIMKIVNTLLCRKYDVVEDEESMHPSKPHSIVAQWLPGPTSSISAARSHAPKGLERLPHFRIPTPNHPFIPANNVQSQHKQVDEYSTSTPGFNDSAGVAPYSDSDEEHKDGSERSEDTDRYTDAPESLSPLPSPERGEDDYQSESGDPYHTAIENRYLQGGSRLGRDILVLAHEPTPFSALNAGEEEEVPEDPPGSSHSSIRIADVEEMMAASAALCGGRRLSTPRTPSPIGFHRSDFRDSHKIDKLFSNELWHHSEDGKLHVVAFDPIPFDPCRERQDLRTPSIHSKDSTFECDSPLFKQSCKAVGRDKYLEGEDAMPKAAIAAGLVGISNRELSLRPARHRRRSLSVFRDEYPDTSTLPPKPAIQKPLQDVTDRYYSLANEQLGFQDSEATEKVTVATHTLDTEVWDEELSQLSSAIPVPLVDDHFVVPFGDRSEVTIDLGSSLIMPASSPHTSPEPMTGQSDTIISSPLDSPCFPYRLSTKTVHQTETGKATQAKGVLSRSESKVDAPAASSSGRVNAHKTLRQQVLGSMVLNDVKDWRRRQGLSPPVQGTPRTDKGKI